MGSETQKKYPRLADEVPHAPLKSLKTLWLQIGGTLCNLQCTHCFISCGPKNNNHKMMTLDQVRDRLNEANCIGVQDYYITGGEIFLNPQIFEILEEILNQGPLNMLTNGTLLTLEKCIRLRNLQNRSKNPMTFRVSMEHFDESANDKVRGRGSYRKALQGVNNLAEVGFSTILTVTRSWDQEEDLKMKEKLLHLLRRQKTPLPRIKILPPFLLGRQVKADRSYNENEYVTKECFKDYDISNLQCTSCRMVTATGVYVCPILVDEPSGRMGDKLDETLHPFPLSHSACYTCRVTGMTCTN
tara:strand:- start:471 stop:1370 length:900 start_codon:yes stop_codon:yes gene_type:complete